MEWFIGARTVLYGFVLAWMLLGIMLISDVFMSAIEEITGQEKFPRSPSNVRARGCLLSLYISSASD